MLAMSNEPCIAAAILAGGHARRLGSIDKSALTIDGVPIMSRLLDVLRRITPHVFAVGDRYGAAAHAGLRVVPDAISDGGPLGGIYTAITRSPCDRTLVVGCDMPFLTAQFLQHLAQLSDCDRGQTGVRPPGSDPGLTPAAHAVVIPRGRNGYEPLCAVYTRESAAPIRKRLERGERHAACPPDGVPVIEVGPEELAPYDPHGLLFVNVNTPHDYAEARRVLRPFENRSIAPSPIEGRQAQDGAAPTKLKKLDDDRITDV